MYFIINLKLYVYKKSCKISTFTFVQRVQINNNSSNKKKVMWYNSPFTNIMKFSVCMGEKHVILQLNHHLVFNIDEPLLHFLHIYCNYTPSHSKFQPFVKQYRCIFIELLNTIPIKPQKLIEYCTQKNYYFEIVKDQVKFNFIIINETNLKDNLNDRKGKKVNKRNDFVQTYSVCAYMLLLCCQQYNNYVLKKPVLDSRQTFNRPCH